jgi:hypothetical protein
LVFPFELHLEMLVGNYCMSILILNKKFNLFWNSIFLYRLLIKAQIIDLFLARQIFRNRFEYLFKCEFTHLIVDIISGFTYALPSSQTTTLISHIGEFEGA